ncbi:MAG: hypothetical protein ACYCS4_14365, partial [Acidimicrobiales bacterium]
MAHARRRLASTNSLLGRIAIQLVFLAALVGGIVWANGRGHATVFGPRPAGLVVLLAGVLEAALVVAVLVGISRTLRALRGKPAWHEAPTGCRLLVLEAPQSLTEL